MDAGQPSPLAVRLVELADLVLGRAQLVATVAA